MKLRSTATLVPVLVLALFWGCAHESNDSVARAENAEAPPTCGGDGTTATSAVATSPPDAPTAQTRELYPPIMITSAAAPVVERPVAVAIRIADAPSTDPAFHFDDAPLTERSPSVVATPSTDEVVVLGEYPLARAVDAVVDGDTIRVDGLDKSLRLIGIDTEETYKSPKLEALARRDWKAYLARVNEGADPARPPKYGTPCGLAAKDFAERFFKELQDVRLEYDTPRKKRGYYGRHLVFVLAKKQGMLVNYNVEIVRQGLSPYFVKYGRCERYHENFLAAEREARRAGRGIWADTPAHACYPDYPARLAWWSERDTILQRIRARKAAGEELYVLGDDADWEALKKKVGQRVFVVGTPAEIIKLKRVWLQPISHRKKKDFIIAGKPADIEALGLEKQIGNLLILEGKISLHKGRPQFKLADYAGFQSAQ